MPDINNAVALGVQTPKPQTTTDIIAPITSLAQLSYLNANAEKVKAETSQYGLANQFTQGKLQALSNYNDLVKSGVPQEKALIQSGVSLYDAPGANATLGNIKTANELTANRGYAAANPDNPLALAGPEYAGKDVTNKATEATTRETNVKVTQQQSQFYGRVGNLLTSPGGTSPQGRQMAIAMARQYNIPEPVIQQFATMPDDQLKLAGQHLQAAAMDAGPYLKSSGQEKFNEGLAAAATQNDKLGKGETRSYGPASYAVTHELPVPGMPGGAPSSGVVGQPSLGNFAPPAAQPQSGVPTLAGPGGAPAQPGLTPAAPVPAAPAAAGAPPVSPGPNVRNVNAVSVPSVGVNVPPEIAAAAKKNGVSENYLTRTAQIESNFNPAAYNAQSKAAGVFQFVPSTGAKYLNGSSPFDLAGSADAAARLAVDNKAALTQSLGREPTDAELYLAHQQGAAGAAKLLSNPNARAGDLVGNTAIAANGGNPSQPASAFVSLWKTKFDGGVGRTIPAAGLSPNVTAAAPAPASGAPEVMPGAIAPLAATLTPSAAPRLAASPAPTTAPPPIQNATPTVPAAAPGTAQSLNPTQPATSAAPPATGLAADQTKPLLPEAYHPVDTGPSPELIAEQEGVGKNAADKYAEAGKQYQAAQNTKYRLDLIDHSINELGPSGWMGAKAEQRANLAKSWNTIADQFPGGDKFKIDPSKIANTEDLSKQTTNLGFELAKTLGSREAMQIVQQATNAVPNASQTMMGAKLVSSSLRQAVQRQEDYYAFLDARAKSGQSLVGADKAFAEANPVSAYSKAAIASSGVAVPIDSKVEYDHLPKGATFTRDGKTWQKP